MNPLNRREFLEVAARALATTGFAVALPSSAYGKARERGQSAADDLLPDLSAASELGRQYLKRYPDRAELQDFAREVFGDGATPIDARPEDIAVRVRGDFLAGRVVNLKGWRLAKSEALLCAIVATGDDFS